MYLLRAGSRTAARPRAAPSRAGLAGPISLPRVMIRIPSTTTRLLVLGLLCLAAPSAGAQERGAIEIGAAVRWMTFDVSHRLQDKVGLAGHVGIFPLRDVSIEGQVSQHRTSVRRESGQDVKHRTSYLRALQVSDRPYRSLRPPEAAAG